MPLKTIAAGLTLCCLTACASLSNGPPPKAVQQANLVAPCPPFPARPLQTNRDLAQAYLDALVWGADCRTRHNLQNAEQP